MKYSQAAANDSTVFNYLQKDALPVFLSRREGFRFQSSLIKKQKLYHIFSSFYQHPTAVKLSVLWQNNRKPTETLIVHEKVDRLLF